MKKYKLLEKAMRDYPAGTVARFGGTPPNHISTGQFQITDLNNNGNIQVMSLDGVECFYADGEWAQTIDKDGKAWDIVISNDKGTLSTRPIGLLDGRCAIQVNNEREFKLLMEHYTEKGWKWADGQNPLELPYLGPDVAASDAITYHNGFSYFSKDSTIIPLADFAAEIGIEAPVFVLTSEDGVPMYNGDLYYRAELVNNKWILSEWKGDVYYGDLCDTDFVVHSPGLAKAFSNREAAEKWLAEQNKPKSTTIVLFYGGTAEVYSDHIYLHGGLKVSPSDLEDMMQTYKSLQP